MDIVEKLRRACNGNPAVIQWPHRGLHDAADEIERLRTVLASIAANTCCDRCQEAALVATAALEANSI